MKKSSSALNPPADAPIPTMGNEAFVGISLLSSTAIGRFGFLVEGDSTPDGGIEVNRRHNFNFRRKGH
ncbi:hypothetical protein [Rhodoblastus sp.]|uniref:hypothetical protein n=1 Tax=Rhodoblastus sp. TaxID=1962975 RepID=UPI003F9AD0D7